MNFLKNECDILFQLDHDNVIQIYEVFDNTDDFYIVMEYVAGRDLDDRYISQGVRNETVICKVVLSLTNALEFCHMRNVIHRDLKVACETLSRRISYSPATTTTPRTSWPILVWLEL